MSQAEPTRSLNHGDTAPGDQRVHGEAIAEGIKTYLIGLGLATLLTIVSFFISQTTLVWGPSIPVALVVLAIAQMGVHLVFFLHITTGPDNVNNVLALAFGVLIVFLLLAGSLWIMANMNNNMALMEQTMQMQTERAPSAGDVTVSGLVAPAASAPVRARVSGEIQAVYCEAGAQVKAGQLCAKIDPRPYQELVDQTAADLRASEARLEKNKANLAEAKAAFERDEALGRRRAASRKALERSRRAFERAQAETNQDEAKIADLQAAARAAEANLAGTDIASPIDGAVVSGDAELGKSVQANAEAPPLFIIAEGLEVVQIKATVDAKYGSELKVGDKVTFTVAGFPKRVFSGAVAQISPSAPSHGEPETSEVVISAPNPDLSLKPGMSATVKIAIE